MPAGLVITIYLASALVAGTLAGMIAPRKRRSAGFWTAATFLFPPLLLILIFLPRGRTVERYPAHDDHWASDNLDRLD
jgi:cyanate permease